MKISQDKDRSFLIGEKVGRIGDQSSLDQVCKAKSSYRQSTALRFLAGNQRLNIDIVKKWMYISLHPICILGFLYDSVGQFFLLLLAIIERLPLIISSNYSSLSMY